MMEMKTKILNNNKENIFSFLQNDISKDFYFDLFLSKLKRLALARVPRILLYVQNICRHFFVAFVFSVKSL